MEIRDRRVNHGDAECAEVSPVPLHLHPLRASVVGQAFPLLLVVLILLFFHKMAFSNLILARGDTFLYFYPYWDAAAEALRNGRIPLWNPNLFMGAPFLANSQVGFFYPLNWPLWLLLPAPYAVSASILLHLAIAGWGTYVAGRRVLGLGQMAALFAALLFVLGGYLTAQVEHVNQLQGLAWLPWFLGVLHQGAVNGNKSWWQAAGETAVYLTPLFALQLLAGHTQTSFITGIGLGIWVVAYPAVACLQRHRDNTLHFTVYAQRLLRRILPAVAGGIVLAGLVTAAQLLPTLELVQHSGRQGGLSANEVLSFSLHPLLLARSLLPGYGQSLFSEYAAFLPVTALLLAVVGGWQWRRWRGVGPLLVLALAGLLLALGWFNPLNWLLARLPGFNLFRAPARWLVLYSLALALLAGVGWQVAQDRWLVAVRPWPTLPARVARGQEKLWQVERPLRVGTFLVLGLMAWSVIATVLAIFFPTGPEAPYEAPTAVSVLMWGGELLLALAWLRGGRIRFDSQARFNVGLSRAEPRSPLLLVGISAIVLFFASRSHPYNNLTTPAAYFDLRPPVARLQAETDGQKPPSRLLSLSNIFFDVGDEAELATIYDDQLPPAAFRDYLVAIKQKEIVGPNLPLVYGLHSVDGFDGGVLPISSYSALMQAITPTRTPIADGRLREHLDAIPDTRWLWLFNAGYLITDKVGDEWREGVYFDRQHAVTVQPGETVFVTTADYEATEIWLLASGEPGAVTAGPDARRTWELTPQPMEEGLWRVVLPEPMVPVTLSLNAQEDGAPWRVEGVALVDGRDDTFHTASPGPYRLIYSGDVKIYEHAGVSRRAFLVHQWTAVANNAQAIAAMQAESFLPWETAVVATTDPLPQPSSSGLGEASIVRYEPEQVVIHTNSSEDALLVLADANYPGWQSTIGGQPAPIYQVDGLFRGVFVPAGQHEVMFEFRPDSFAIGRVVSVIGLVVWLLLVATVLIRQRT